MSEISHRSLELKTKVGRRHYFFLVTLLNSLVSVAMVIIVISVFSVILSLEKTIVDICRLHTLTVHLFVFFLQLTSAVKCFCLDQMSCLDCFLKILQTQQLIITNDILVLWYDPLVTLIDFEKSELFRTLYGCLLSRSLI